MGVPERKKREKELRRKAILDAAEKVFFGRKGENATMDDVADRAELSKGTLYLYFRSKEDILYALAGRGVERLAGTMKKVCLPQDSGIEQLSKIADSFIEFSDKYPKYFGLILKFENKTIKYSRQIYDKLLIEPALDILYEVLKKGQADGSIRDDIGARDLVAIIWSQMLGVLQTITTKKKILHQYKVDAGALIKGHYKLIIKGISPDRKAIS
jgi:AcrR family transcriptional regulator